MNSLGRSDNEPLIPTASAVPPESELKPVASESQKTPEQELKDVEAKIAALTAMLNKPKPSAKWEAVRGLVGPTVNAGVFLTLNTYAPGLGMWGGGIASAAGSVTQMAVNRASGHDSGPKLSTTFRTLDGIALSEGIRGIGGLIPNPVGEVIVKTALPAMVQGGFHHNGAKTATIAGGFAELRELNARRDALLNQLERGSEITTAWIINIKPQMA